jgi:hypothetical protein
VFWNLLRNAIKFTPSGGQITVHCRSEEGWLVAEIADTGRGIDPAILSKLFAPFEQGSVDVTRQFGGLGLGLAISRMLVELHHGTLTAQSAGKDQGATFMVRLPLSAEAARLLGQATLASLDERTLRSVPACFGVGLPLLFLALRRRLGAPAVASAMLFAALSPALVYYSRFYILVPVMIIAGAVMFAQRTKNWERGKPDNRSTTSKNFKRRMTDFRAGVYMQTLLRDPAAGIMHSLIYYSFLVLLAVTILEIDHQAPAGLKFLHDGTYQAYSFIADLAGLTFLAGVVWALVRKAGEVAGENAGASLASVR